jgi:peptidoglycan/LPS O-acetylase OafA/YrhL
VVVFHAGLGLPGGFIGVDVFFVISGFLITGLLLRERLETGRIDFVAFYARRIRRLLPAALVVLAITLPIAYLLFTPLDRPQMIWDAAASAISLGNVRFALSEGDYFANLATPSPFLHFWSLGVEEQFYLVWPALLAFAAMWRRNPRRGAWIALFDVFAASLTAVFVLTTVAPNWAFYSLPTRAFELAAGGLLAVVAPTIAKLPRWLMGPLGWLSAASIVTAALTLDSAMAFPGLIALVPTFGAVGLIAAGLAPRSRRRIVRWLSPAGLMSVGPMRLVGRISYSLYLWHWPIFVLAGVYLGFGRTPDPVVALWLIGVAMGVAMVSWALIEEPFRRGVSLPRLQVPQFRPSVTVAAGLAGMASVVLLANSLALAADTDLQQIAHGGDVALVPTLSAATASPDEPDPTDPPAVIMPSGTPFTPTATPVPRPTATPAPPPPTATERPTQDPIQLPTDGPPTPKPTPGPTAAPTPQPTLSEYALATDVQPALIEARADKEKLWSNHCLGIEATVVPKTCVFGDPNSSYTVALVGDSHGSAMFPAFEWMAQHNGWRLITFVKVACPFLDIPVQSTVLKREYSECAQWNENVVAALNAAPPNLTVVSMSHWIFPVDTSLGMADYSASLARMIGRLAGKTVILADTPHSAVDVPGCLSANSWDIRPCATRKAQAMSQHGVLEGAAAAAAGVALIDLSSEICAMGPCMPVVSDMIVYRDAHHLTATFSASLGPALERLVNIVR